MAEQVLYIQLASVLLDHPRSERVAETVSMNLGDAGPLRQPPEHLLQAVGLQRDARAESTVPTRCREQRPWLCTPAAQVLIERLTARQ